MLLLHSPLVWGVVLLLGLSACSTTRTTTTVVPAREDTRVVETDTLFVPRLRPVEMSGVPTVPLVRREAVDPIPEGPSVAIRTITLDGDELTVRTDSTEEVYRAPAYGEELALFAGPDGFSALLDGAPAPRTLDVEETTRDSPWAVFSRVGQWTLIGIVAVLAFALLIPIVRFLFR